MHKQWRRSRQTARHTSPLQSRLQRLVTEGRKVEEGVGQELVVVYSSFVFIVEKVVMMSSSATPRGLATSPFLVSTPMTRTKPSSRLLKRLSNVNVMSTTHKTVKSRLNLNETHNLTNVDNDTRKLGVAAEKLNESNVYNYTSVSQRLLETSFPEVDEHNVLQTSLSAFDVSMTSSNLMSDLLACLEHCTSTAASVDEGLIDQGLDVVAEFEQLMDDTLATLDNRDDHSTLLGSHKANVRERLLMERKTWRLLGRLFGDVFNSSSSVMISVDKLTTEEELVEQAFNSDRSLRLLQLFVDWLESAHDEAMDGLRNGHGYHTAMSDTTVVWDNTLHTLITNNELKQKQKVVTELDPDACKRQKRPIHTADQREQDLLLNAIFLYIRSGKVDAAEALCERKGAPWRSAVMRGWRLFHDPNLRNSNEGIKSRVEGNLHRMAWKKMAWLFSEDPLMSNEERAIFSALCGNCTQLIEFKCRFGWEDAAWALARSAVDVKVERLIRENNLSGRSSKTGDISEDDLPSKYWQSDRSVREILELLSTKNSLLAADVKEEAMSPFRQIQSCILLEDWQSLYDLLSFLVLKDMSGERADQHLIRFAAHLVVALRLLLSNHATIIAKDIRAKVERPVARYIDCLIKAKKLRAVAFYTSWLSDGNETTVLYAQLMSTLNLKDDRRMCIELAQEFDLPLRLCRGLVVDETLAMIEEESDLEENKKGVLSNLDYRKIDILEWLLIEPRETDMALRECNRLARLFITKEKIVGAQAALDKMRPMIADLDVNSSEVLNDEYVREFLALEAFVRAKESFEDWFTQYYKGRPQVTLQDLEKSNDSREENFAQQMAREQKKQELSNQLERWRSAVRLQMRDVEEKILCVLKFPRGWLSLPSDDNEVEEESLDQRTMEVLYLRRKGVVDLVLLLVQVYQASEMHSEVIQLSNLVASNDQCLFGNFTQDEMKSFLNRIRQSSIKLLDQHDSDAWGFSISEPL